MSVYIAHRSKNNASNALDPRCAKYCSKRNVVSVKQRVDGGWRNKDAVVQQLERPVYTAQTDNTVPMSCHGRTGKWRIEHFPLLHRERGTNCRLN